MEMTQEKSEKLKRYFINADPFLWDLLTAKNKKGRIKELKTLGFLLNYSEGTNATYSKINQDLLVEPGFEGILKIIIEKYIYNRFTPDILSYFRRCWEQGQSPEIAYLKKNKLYRSHFWGSGEQRERPSDTRIVGHKDSAHIFLQINRQYEFVEGWTVFAGLWFEEIEAMIKIPQPK